MSTPILSPNSEKHTCKSEEYTWHVKSQEIPLLVCMGVMLHAKIPKRELLDRLHALGIPIAKSNSAMSVISSANVACERFKEMDTICPPNLKTNVFTAEIVDKIDHDMSSTTDIRLFHGTCIALIQHPTEVCYTLSRICVRTSNHSNPCASSLHRLGLDSR